MSNKNQELRFGLRAATIEKICTVLAKHQRIEKAVIYGSRAKGNYKPGSDIDLTLYGNLTLDDLATVMDELDDLLLPYSIDLSLFDELNHAKLREHIERIGLVFYERGNAGGVMKAGWEIKKLEQLSKKKDAVVSGPFGSNLKVSDYKTEGIPILRLQNIGKGYFIDKSIKYINEEKAEELKYHSFISGDIALAKLGIPIGKTCIIPNHFKSGIITADIVRIRPDLNIVDYKYLEYFLNTDLSVAQLTGNISGATRPRVNLSDVRNIEIPIPPLPEQQRIVAILDEAFEGIATATANAENNLNNARELFDSTVQSIFANKGEGWLEKTIKEITSLLGDGLHGTPKYTDGGEYYFINGNNLDDGKIVFKESTKRVSATEYEKHKKNLSERTIFSVNKRNFRQCCVLQ
jgi:type I restriction enzyme S subunit